MPLPPGTFTGEDLTTMEFRVFDRLREEKAEKKAAWELSQSRSSKDGEGLVMGKGEGEGEEVNDGAQNETTTSEVDASAASTIVAPTPVPTPGISQGDDGDEDDTFEDALENLEVQANGTENTASALPTSTHSETTEFRKSSGHHSKEEIPLPAILLPDFETITPPSSSIRSRSRSRSRSSFTRSRSGTPRPFNSHPSPPPPVPPGLVPFDGQGPPPTPPPPELPVHGTLRCEGCGGPIAGTRYKCMESVTCPHYNLCEVCYAHKAHTEGHRFLEIPTLAESALVFCHDDMEQGNQVILGLKVYTNKTAGTKIEAQLRHGDIIRVGLRRNLVI